MRYYYYPLCTKDFTFENIFASESVSPSEFYPIRGFGFNYFYRIQQNHPKAVILYNALPKYELPQEAANSVKFIIGIEESALDINDFILIDEGIIAYPKTIYLTRKNCKIIFFSEKDRKMACLNAEVSLPTKSLKKFDENFVIALESDCKSYELETIRSWSNEDGVNPQEIEKDRRYNFFKGFIYGFSCGQLLSKSPIDAKIKQSLQLITNSFALLKNKLDTDTPYSKYAKPSIKPTGFGPHYEKLGDAILETQELFKKFAPSREHSEKDIAAFLIKKFPNRLKSQEDAETFLNHMFLFDEILGQNGVPSVMTLFFKENSESNPDILFQELRHYTYQYAANSKVKGGQAANVRDSANDRFKSIIFQLGKVLEKETLKGSQTKEIDLSPIRFNFSENQITISDDFSQLNHESKTEYELIVNIIIKKPKLGRRDTRKETVLSIVQEVSAQLSKSKFTKPSQLYQYLNGEIDTYSIEKVNSVVMKNFVAFVFNPDSSEKLESFMAVKEIEQTWIGYSFWCAYNGFANTSGNFLQSIFESKNKLLQDYLDGYVSKQFASISMDFEVPVEPIKEVETIVEPAELLADQKQVKTYEYYQNFIEKKYPVTFENFQNIVQIDEVDLMIQELKDKYKIGKRDGKKIIDSYKDFMSAAFLF